MNKNEKIQHKVVNQRRRILMLGDKSRDGKNLYSHLEYGFIQKGKYALEALAQIAKMQETIQAQLPV
jgi:hypothetical protein